jgi:hypothetical protein
VGAKERIAFSKLISQLPNAELNYLVDRVAAGSPEALNEEDEDEVEIDINSISGALLLELNQFMKKAISGRTK